jgi:8-oxo-dGTP pyrophosphatase MutT (NUDIX family)/chorismate mutase
MTVLSVVLTVVLAALVVLALVVWCLLRANRLDRLHVRTDAARAALRAALERRAVVARAIAATRADQALRDVADTAERAPAADREARENDLSGRLARLERGSLPPELAAELAAAEQRVMLARRVYNDAVRDTLVLRSRRLVRWLRLAGTAPAPTYFEIVDVAPDPGDGTGPVVAPLVRRAGRVVLVDTRGRTLLFEGFDPARPQESYWFTPGGALEPGEDAHRAAVRELAEETGLRLPPERLVGPVWRAREVFSYDGAPVVADETYFLVGTESEHIDTSGITDLERLCVVGHRWWSVEELRTSSAVVYPRRLAELLEPLLDGGWDGVTRSIS